MAAAKIRRRRTRHVAALDYDQYSVGGVPVDDTTIKPIASPTRELLRTLKKKSMEWKRQDDKLAKKRARVDGSFREDNVDKDFEVHLVREAWMEAFYAFWDAIRKEDRRLRTERRAEVAELVKRFKKKAP